MNFLQRELRITWPQIQFLDFRSTTAYMIVAAKKDNKSNSTADAVQVE